MLFGREMYRILFNVHAAKSHMAKYCIIVKQNKTEYCKNNYYSISYYEYIKSRFR